MYENSSAVAAAGITVAVAVKDNEDKQDYPNIAVVEKIAEAAHLSFRTFSFLVGRTPRHAALLPS